MGCSISASPTDGAENPLDGLAGLLVIRDDPTLRLPGAASALANIETVVVIDNVLHPTAQHAAVVIAEGRPYTSRGTYTQMDFRVQRLAAAVKPEGDAVPLLDALHALGAALGVDLPATADDAMGEIAKQVPDYQPAYDLIVGDGVRLAVPASPKAVVGAAAGLQAQDGIRIITGRDLYTALDAAELRHPEAEKLHRYDRIQVSEEDAGRLGIHTGDEIEISSGDAAIRAKATVTERVPEGAVYVSSLLQGGAVVQFFSGASIPTVRLGVPVPA